MSIQFINENPTIRRRQEIEADDRARQQAAITQAREERSAQQFEDDQAFQEAQYDYYSRQQNGNAPANGNGHGMQVIGINGAATAPKLNTPPAAGVGIQSVLNRNPTSQAKPTTPDQMSTVGIQSFNQPQKPVNKRATGRFLAELNKLRYQQSQDRMRQANADRTFAQNQRNQDRVFEQNKAQYDDSMQMKVFDALSSYWKTGDPASLQRARVLGKRLNVPIPDQLQTPAQARAYDIAARVAKDLLPKGSPQAKTAAIGAGIKAVMAGGREEEVVQAIQATFSQGGGAGQLEVRDKPYTDAQSKAAAFGNRMVQAEGLMSGMIGQGFEPGKFFETHLSDLPLVGNYTSSPEYQQYMQAASDWVRAKLRRESGAVIGDEEMAKEIQTYFPQPGDSPQVIAQKEQSRQIATQNLIAESQGAYRSFFGRNNQPNSQPSQTIPVAAPAETPRLTPQDINGGGQVPQSTSTQDVSVPQATREPQKLPQNATPGRLIPGQTYMTKHGVLRWDGDAFVRDEQPIEQAPNSYELGWLERRAAQGDQAAQSRLTNLRLRGVLPWEDEEVMRDMNAEQDLQVR